MIIGKTRTNQPVEKEEGFDTQVENIIESGEVDNAKPIYYHPITIWGDNNAPAYYKSSSVSIVALTNYGNVFTKATFLEWLKENHITYLSPASGSVNTNDAKLIVAWIDIYYDEETGNVSSLSFRGHFTTDNDNYLEQVTISATDFDTYFQFGDSGVNKIN